jgi:hypothetical protein
MDFIAGEEIRFNAIGVVFAEESFHFPQRGKEGKLVAALLNYLRDP